MNASLFSQIGFRNVRNISYSFASAFFLSMGLNESWQDIPNSPMNQGGKYFSSQIQEGKVFFIPKCGRKRDCKGINFAQNGIKYIYF